MWLWEMGSMWVGVHTKGLKIKHGWILNLHKGRGGDVPIFYFIKFLLYFSYVLNMPFNYFFYSLQDVLCLKQNRNTYFMLELSNH